MNMQFSGLMSSPENRRVINRNSSASALGLNIGNVLQHGLVSSPEDNQRNVVSAPTIQEAIFTALAEAKIWTSRVAMHMDRQNRDRYFRQLDLLHDVEEWVGDESPVLLGSFKSFIRFMLLIKSPSKPSLALAPAGHLIAIWLDGSDRLTIEFDKDDHARWVVSRIVDGTVERAAGTAKIARILEVLAPYRPAGWLLVG